MNERLTPTKVVSTGEATTENHPWIGIAFYQEQERAAAHFTTPQIAEIRAVILRVIDDGNPLDKRERRWHFDTDDQVTIIRASIDTGGDDLRLSEQQREALADKARLDFCDRVQELLVATAKQEAK